MKILDGICNISIKGLKDFLQKDSKSKYAILFLYSERDSDVCERFLENYATYINNTTNLQIMFFTRYTSAILNKLESQVGYDEIERYYNQCTCRVNAFDIMLAWARIFEKHGMLLEKIENNRYNIQTPTFIIVSPEFPNEPIVVSSRKNVNDLRNTYERIIKIIWNNYSNYENIRGELITAMSNKKAPKKTNYDATLYFYVDDKLHEHRYRWCDLNNNLRFRSRNTIQDKLRKGNIDRNQLICIGLLSGMEIYEIDTLLNMAKEPLLNPQYKPDDKLILDALDKLMNQDNVDRIGIIEDLQNKLDKKMPIKLYED